MKVNQSVPTGREKHGRGTEASPYVGVIKGPVTEEFYWSVVEVDVD